jgi:rhodanese-related sulfurtransferase
VSGTGERPLGIDELLERVRSGYDRIEPQDAYQSAQAGEALLVDIRYAALRERDGLIPGALVVERNELEWRLDPRGSHRTPEATSHDVQVVVICNEGYASSLAVESLRRLGLHRATDLVGGFQAWRSAELPVTSAGTSVVAAEADGDRETPRSRNATAHPPETQGNASHRATLSGGERL